MCVYVCDAMQHDAHVDIMSCDGQVMQMMNLIKQVSTAWTGCVAMCTCVGCMSLLLELLLLRDRCWCACCMLYVYVACCTVYAVCCMLYVVCSLLHVASPVVCSMSCLLLLLLLLLLCCCLALALFLLLLHADQHVHIFGSTSYMHNMTAYQHMDRDIPSHGTASPASVHVVTDPVLLLFLISKHVVLLQRSPVVQPRCDLVHIFLIIRVGRRVLILWCIT